MINNFRGKWFFLSNFYPCLIEHRGIKYPSVEHYYVAMKINDMQLINGVYYTPNDFREFISKIEPASEVKKISKKLKLRNNWDRKKIDFMKWGLKEKFKDEKLSELLLSTGEEDLVEGNWWHDNIWGSCYCYKCGNTGENLLGKLLMEIREEIKNELPLH
jgi:ribA/ribD-fused uncharacterized protein